MESLDIDHLKTWIGETETVEDQITASLIDRFRATFYDKLWPTGDAAPLGLHWCLAPPAAPGNALGPDGHPRRGGFLPPVPLPSRMWAGGDLTFHEPLRAGDRVTRSSRIANVILKQGKSGPLVFVTIDHQCSVDGTLAVSERQDIVYKQAIAKPSATQIESPEPSVDADADALTVNAVDLFRYSALTFNGHRIHYDREYAQSEEGYPGLVVHGPFQGTLLMNRAAELCGGVPARFSFRGVAPLFDQTPFWLRASTTADGGEVWCEGVDGNPTMKAEFSAR
ncbi:MAG: MaoC family dehydratase N-terminal domain-containing protein [Immundisolibacteraceae bacterium]|nr:MaoC family dehydratase N-terminal domain-containing protein [Immundisolibacteraceae bacterium]